MTTTEAQTLADRLSRVWRVEMTPTGRRGMNARLSNVSRLYVADYATSLGFQLEGPGFGFYCLPGGAPECCLREERAQRHSRIVHLAFVRFCALCWLSGFSIEASNHEKMSWLLMARDELGLSEEELQGVKW